MQAKGGDVQMAGDGSQRLLGGTVLVAIIFVALAALGVCSWSGTHIHDPPKDAELLIASEAPQMKLLGSAPCPPATLPSAVSPALVDDRPVRTRNRRRPHMIEIPPSCRT